MRYLSALWFSLRALFVRDRVADEIDEELAYHLEREAQLYRQSGMSADAARREAKRRFGGALRYREECRDVRRVSAIDDLRADVRYTLRMARHHPGFSASIILISALGIAACVSTFSLVSGILLAPLSFPEPDRVFNLYLQSADGSNAAIPSETYFRSANEPVFDGVAASEPTLVTVTGNGEPTRVRGAVVTPSYFRVYRIRPYAGRAFTDQDIDTRAPVVILSYEEWQRRYADDRSAIGGTIVLDGKPQTIVGIMPPHFLGNFEGNRFTPVVWQPQVVEHRGTVGLTLRVADSVPVQRAEAWLKATVRAKVASYRTRDSLAASPILVPVAEQIYGDVQRPLEILLASVALVLLLVAANIATMFLARSSARAGELGLRTALGATPGRQFRQLITESLTLTAIGGMAGVAVSIATISMIRSLGQLVLPRIDNVTIDWRVLLFAVGGVLVTGCAGGVAHALASRRHSGANVGTTSRFTTRSSSTALVVAQLALSVTLLSGAGLLVKGFMRVAPSNPGFAVAHRAALSLLLTALSDSASDPARDRATAVAIADRLRGVAGVEDVALTSFVPLSGLVSIVDVQPTDWAPDAERLTAFSNMVSPNFFGVMQIPLKLGRVISATDVEGSQRVAVINETAAARWWPSTDPVGKQLVVGKGKRQHVVTVVGVVGGTRTSGRNTRMVPELYEAASQAPVRRATFVVATKTDPRALLPALQRALHEILPSEPLLSSEDLARVVAASVRIQRFYSVAMSLFAIAAVVLSALGVYGLLSFAVAQRRKEIGIRMALGATTTRIGSAVIGQAVLIAVTGVAIGGLLARVLSKYMASLLTEVKATDPAVFAVAIAAVFAFAILAACAPTWQAVRVDPIKSLRV